jgi:hypothetical protein
VLQPTSRCEAFDKWAEEMDLRAPFADWPGDVAATKLEFLFAQNPLGEFRPGRKQLPGQRYPGLGIARNIKDLVVWAGSTHNRELLTQTPDHFHSAFIYKRGGFQFISPHCQAWFDLMCDDLAPLLKTSFAEVSHKIYDGKLRFKGVVVVWPHWEQATPISDRLKALFEANAVYVEKLRAQATGERPFFTLDD